MKIGDNAATNMMNFSTTVKKSQQNASAQNQGVQAADPDKDGDNEATETAKTAKAEGARGANVDTTA